MADDEPACSFSVEEIKSLTVPRLKAELAKRNQPLGNLKRKSQLIAALTACVDQKQKGQHETKVPDLGNAEEGEEDGGSEASELSGEAHHPGPRPERANSEGADPKREPPVNEAGEKSDVTRQKGDATGKEISADEDGGGSSQKQAEESIPMDPSRHSPDAKLDATGAEPERVKPDRAAVKQKEAKLKSDGDAPVGAEDTSPHGIPESSSKGEDEPPKAVDPRDGEVQGKPRSEKTRTPSKSESTPRDRSTPVGSPMDVDEGEGSCRPEDSTPATSKSKTHKKSRKRANKAVVDENPPEAQESGTGSRETKEGSRGAHEGNNGGAGRDDAADTPEPKSKRSRKSSLPGKVGNRAKGHGSTKERDGSQKVSSSSKKTATVAAAAEEEPSKEDDVVADTGHRNGGVAEGGAGDRAGDGGDDGGGGGDVAQEGKGMGQGEPQPMEEDSNGIEEDERKERSTEMENEGQSAAPSFEGPRTGAETTASSASDAVAENATERAISSKLDAADPANTSAPAAPAVVADDASPKEAREGGDETNGKTEEDEKEEGGAQELNPVTIRVDNFVRPFTAPQAKKLVEEKAGAPVLEEGFWMDSIKTHCYATFDGEEAAKRAIDALQGLQWPERSSKRLAAKMGDVSAQEARARDDAKRAVRKLGGHPTAAVTAAGVAAAAAAAAAVTGKLGPRGIPGSAAATTGTAGTGSGARAAGSNGVTGNGKSASGTDGVGSQGVRGRGSVQAPGVERHSGREGQEVNGDVSARDGGEDKVEDDEAFVLDKLFRKTTTTPCLYWLPLTEEEVGERKKRMEAAGLGPRTTQMPAEQLAAIGAGSRNGGGPWAGAGGDRRDYGSGSLSYSSRYGYRDQYYGRAAGGRRR